MLKDRLISLRKQKGLSQYDAADRLGFSRGKLANYEQGTRQPDYGTLEEIANFYNVSIDFLLGRTDNETPFYNVPLQLVQQNLPRIRKWINISIQELAEEMELSPEVIKNWENGEAYPTSLQVNQLNSVFSKLSDDYKRALELNTTQIGIPVLKIKRPELSEYDPMTEINELLKKYNIDQSGFFDIEKWKAMGPDGIKQLESYFQFIVQEAEKKNEQQD